MDTSRSKSNTLNKMNTYKPRKQKFYPTIVCSECNEIYHYSFENHCRFNLIHRRWLLNVKDNIV